MTVPLRELEKMEKEKQNIAPREPSYYEQLTAIDVIDPIMHLWKQRQIETPLEGKFHLRATHSLSRTWIFTRMCTDRDCGNWLNIYAECYKILPPPCKQCWKVVYAPKTLKDLMDVRELQAKMDLDSKCGLEKRDYTSAIGGYRAFWYAPFFDGLEGGRKRFAEVKRALELKFTPETIEEQQADGRLFLKRGCTELERDYGPSDGWEQYDFTAKFNLLNTVWERSANLKTEFSPLIYTIMKRWIEFAVAYGDPTVKEYLGRAPDSPLGVAAIKYHDSDHKSEQFPTYIKPLNGTIEKEKEDESAEKKADLFGFKSAKGKEGSGDESGGRSSK